MSTASHDNNFAGRSLTYDCRPTSKSLWPNTAVAKSQHPSDCSGNVHRRWRPANALPSAQEWCRCGNMRLCQVSFQTQPQRPQLRSDRLPLVHIRSPRTRAGAAVACQSGGQAGNRLSYRRHWTPPGSTRANSATSTSPTPREPSERAAASAVPRASALPARRPCSNGAASFASRASVSAPGEPPPRRQCNGGQSNANKRTNACAAAFGLAACPCRLRPSSLYGHSSIRANQLVQHDQAACTR